MCYKNQHDREVTNFLIQLLKGKICIYSKKLNINTKDFVPATSIEEDEEKR